MTTAKGYTEMKDSGIQWIGQIPTHWLLKKAKYCVSITNGSDPKSEGSVPVYGSGSESFKTCGEYKEGPAVLIGRKGATLHIPHYIEGRYWNVDTAFDVKPQEGFSLRYYYYLACVFDYNYYISQTTLPGMTQTNYNNMKLPCPSLDEQSAIAAYLDTQCAKIDEIIDQAKASMEDYKQWKASIIYEAVTKGLNPNVEMKDSGVEWIGKVPKEWKAIPLKVCTSKIGSGKTPQGGAETYQDNGVLFLRSQNVYNTGLELDGVYYISDEIDSTMKNSRVRYNDVLLNITGGSIGRCCLFDLPDTAANVNQHVCIIRTKPEILLPQFLRYFWNSAAGPMVIDQYQTGSNRQGLNFEQIGATHIPLCSIAEQRQIVAMLDQKCAVIDQLMAEKQSLIDDLESYKKSLIYEVVTGKRYIR